jgi:hypothetical protein
MLNAAATPPSPERAKGNLVQLPLPPFARPEQHFETRPSNKKDRV